MKADLTGMVGNTIVTMTHDRCNNERMLMNLGRDLCKGKGKKAQENDVVHWQTKRTLIAYSLVFWHGNM